MLFLEWVITLLTLIYLYYAIKNDPTCFIFGILASAIWAYLSFNAGLKFDSLLQLFYVGISVLGIYRWKFGGSDKNELPISEYPVRLHLVIVGIGAILSLFLIYLSSFVSFIQLPVLDAITTVILIIGTILLIERKLSCWIYLVIGDIIYIYIYGITSLWLLSGIMIVYTVLGMLGYYNWRKLYNRR